MSRMRPSPVGNSGKYLGAFSCSQFDLVTRKIEVQVDLRSVHPLFFTSELFSGKYIFSAHNSPAQTHINSQFIITGITLLILASFIMFLSLTQLTSILF